MNYYTSDDPLQDNEFSLGMQTQEIDTNKLPPINQKQRIKKAADIHEPKISLSARQMNPDNPQDRRVKPSDLEIINEDLQGSEIIQESRNKSIRKRSSISTSPINMNTPVMTFDQNARNLNIETNGPYTKKKSKKKNN